MSINNDEDLPPHFGSMLLCRELRAILIDLATRSDVAHALGKTALRQRSHCWDHLYTAEGRGTEQDEASMHASDQGGHKVPDTFLTKQVLSDQM